MKTILICGGAGFIGTNFVIKFLNKYSDSYNIIVFDNLTYSGDEKRLKENTESKKFQFIKGDISNFDDVSGVFERENIDYIINFAAETHVDNSIVNPALFMKSNILGVSNLLEVALKYWQKSDWISKRFIQISTDEVYGTLGNDGSFSEKDVLSPNSPYSSSKASGDLIGLSYFKTYNFPFIVTRCSNNYGRFQNSEKFIPKIINRILNFESIPVYGNGENIREWIHVDDHCSAIEEVLFKGKLGEVYNIGSNIECSNIQLLYKIIDIIDDLKITIDNNLLTKNEMIKLITFVEDRKGHDFRYSLNTTKIYNELQWKAKISFNDGLMNTIKYYINEFENL